MTYANVVATFALLFAMSGGALAAKHYLVSSTSQISPKVLKELKGKAGATGRPGPAGAPGEKGALGAPGASGANGTAGPKGDQGVPGLEGEKGPEGPEGGTSASLKRWRKTISVAGTKGSPATVALLTVGPFKVVGRCYKEEGETIASTYLASSESGNFAAEPEEGEMIALPGEGKEVSITPEPAEGEPEEPVFKGPNGGLFSAETKSGTLALDGASNEGVFLSGKSGPACFFSGYAVVQE
jgi:hypothetical protein